MTVGPNTPLWEDHTAPMREALVGQVTADACIVGLGGTGLTAIHECLATGWSTVGVEGRTVASGAAGRNGGLLLAGLAAFYHDARRRLGRERARRLYECTMGEIDRMAADVPAGVRRVGSLRLATTPEEEADCLAHLAALREDGLPGADYRGPEGVGLLIPTDAAFNPLARCGFLAAEAEARGARLFEGTPVRAIESGVVHTDRGTVHAGIIIVAVDGRLGDLIPALAPRLRTARLQMLGTAPAPEVRIPRPVYARFGMEYWQQLPDGRVTLGGFRDLGGPEEWTHQADPTAVIQDALEDLLRNGLRVSAPITHRWAASVSYQEGDLPILEEVLPGVWAMGGYNGTGNLMGPLCARAAVELARTGRSELGELLGAR